MNLASPKWKFVCQTTVTGVLGEAGVKAGQDGGPPKHIPRSARGMQEASSCHLYFKCFVNLPQIYLFTIPPELYRAQIAMRAKAAEVERSRTVIMLTALPAERGSPLDCKEERAADVRGHKILIFQDLSNELSKTQATVNSVKTKLHQMAIKFSLHYPAVPPVTHQQGGHKFTKAEDTERFFNQRSVFNICGFRPTLFL